jgi:hypothetical protein
MHILHSSHIVKLALSAIAFFISLFISLAESLFRLIHEMSVGKLFFDQNMLILIVTNCCCYYYWLFNLSTSINTLDHPWPLDDLSFSSEHFPVKVRNSFRVNCLHYNFSILSFKWLMHILHSSHIVKLALSAVVLFNYLFVSLAESLFGLIMSVGKKVFDLKTLNLIVTHCCCILILIS